MHRFDLLSSIMVLLYGTRTRSSTANRTDVQIQRKFLNFSKFKLATPLHLMTKIRCMSGKVLYKPNLQYLDDRRL